MAPWGWMQWLLSLWLYAATGHAQDDTPANIPDAETFLRAARWRAVVLGDFIYIDGGQVSQEGFTENRDRNPMNATLSIDMSISWSPDSVNIKELSTRDKPNRNNEAYFVDPSGQSFYTWGGYTWGIGPTSDTDVWKLQGDGQGNGQWNREVSENQQEFETFMTTGTAASVSTPDVAFVFGGFEWNNTEKGPSGFYRYNFSSSEWSEERDVGYSTGDGTLWGSTATYVSGFGSAGLIVILGGITDRYTANRAYVPFETVHFYDIGTGKWHNQTASGDRKPSRRSHLCAVGVRDEGPDGSFEIFVYGGGNENEKREYGDIFALSLPGFHWTKIDDRGVDMRVEQACVGVRSSMLSFGGIRPYTDGADGFKKKDPFPRGIGIFDMNALEWRDSYDADAGNYTTHERIRSWYDQGKLDSVDWSSDEVEALFAPSGSSDGSDDEDAGEETGSTTPVGAVAGGVVGGLAGLALVAGITWDLLRRRRKSRRSAEPEQCDSASLSKPPGYQQQTGEAGTWTVELPAVVPPTELEGAQILRP